MTFTLKLTLSALITYCKNCKLAEVKHEYAIYDAARCVRRGIRYLKDKHKLLLNQDKESSIGYLLEDSDRKMLTTLAELELSEMKEGDDRNIDELIDEPYLLKIIKEIKSERVELQKKFDSLTDKIMEIEKHINKNK